MQTHVEVFTSIRGFFASDETSSAALLTVKTIAVQDYSQISASTHTTLINLVLLLFRQKLTACPNVIAGSRCSVYKKHIL